MQLQWEELLLEEQEAASQQQSQSASAVLQYFTASSTLIRFPAAIRKQPAAVRVEEERELLLPFPKLSKLGVSSPRSS
jgi:hypothetical protein